MSTIIEVANCIIELFIVLFFFRRMLNRKELPPWKSSFVILVVLSLHITRSFLPATTYSNLSITALLWSILLITLFKDSILKKLGVLLLYIVVVLINDLFCRIILSAIMGTANHHGPYISIQRYLGMCLSSIMCLSILSLISTIARKKFKPVDFKYWLMMLLFPLFSLFIVVCFDFFLILSGVTDIYYISLLVVTIIGLLYFNTTVFEFIDTYSAKIQLRSAKELIKHQEENYKLLEINERELRKLKHNIDNHMVVMRTLLQNNAVNDSTLLMESLDELTSFPLSVTYTNDSTLDSILNIECKKATEKGIHFLVKTHKLFAPLNLYPIDKSTILCNALNNAIEASEQVEDKTIVVDIAADSKSFTITIENTSLPPRRVSGIFMTTKHDAVNHGFGIESIRLSLEPYNGKMSITHSDGITTCVITGENRH